VSEVKQKERDCLEKNARQVAEELTTMVDDEPGPAGDFVKCYVTTCKKYQFFFSTKGSLMQYAAAMTEAKTRVGVTSRRYIHLLILISKLERCFLNTRRGLVKFPVAKYVTCKWKNVVVRLSAFKGHSLIIKALDFTTYPCT